MDVGWTSVGCARRRAVLLLWKKMRRGGLSKAAVSLRILKIERA